MQQHQNAQLRGIDDKDQIAMEMQRRQDIQKQIMEESVLRKKEQQRKYKEMLDQHQQLRLQMKMHGNMTNVEKQLNKDDLLAWKNYDNN